MAKEIIELDDGVIMRTAVITDAGALSDLVNSNKQFLSRWLDWAKADFDEETAGKLIARGAEARREGRKYELGLFRGGEYVGHITLFAINGKDKSCEMGYWLAEKETGKGLATKTSLKMLEIASNELNLETVKLHTVESNVASNSLAIKLGFKFQSARFDPLHNENVNLYMIKI